MGRKRFEYEIRGYRYAPESFRAFKGLPGQKMEQIPLSDEQRRKMGYLCMTQGGRAGVAYVKHIEREREHKCRRYMTYGFLLKDEPHRYVYCSNLRCRESDTPKERLRILRLYREHLAQTGGRIEQSTECEFDGNFRPVHVRKNYVVADLSRPVVVWLYAA